eukprot:GDKI01032421.1.p1 GENE.GDKI01032421.1~~GDKI01032421.1.p1  ORF type:complete len:103 (-),score=11.84 GDKI01032421.1:434-742(-)
MADGRRSVKQMKAAETRTARAQANQQEQLQHPWRFGIICGKFDSVQSPSTHTERYVQNTKMLLTRVCDRERWQKFELTLTDWNVVCLARELIEVLVDTEGPH